MTNSPDGFELEKIRRDLIAFRVKHGAQSLIGRRCTNLIEQFDNYESAKVTENKPAQDRLEKLTRRFNEADKPLMAAEGVRRWRDLILGKSRL